jgi:hypothetical protein
LASVTVTVCEVAVTAGLKLRPKEPRHSTSMLDARTGPVGPTHIAAAAASTAATVVL